MGNRYRTHRGPNRPGNRCPQRQRLPPARPPSAPWPNGASSSTSRLFERYGVRHGWQWVQPLPLCPQPLHREVKRLLARSTLDPHVERTLFALVPNRVLESPGKLASTRRMRDRTLSHPAYRIGSAGWAGCSSGWPRNPPRTPGATSVKSCNAFMWAPSMVRLVVASSNTEFTSRQAQPMRPFETPDPRAYSPPRPVAPRPHPRALSAPVHHHCNRTRARASKVPRADCSEEVSLSRERLAS